MERPASLALIQLGRDTHLLPGGVASIAISDCPDISALFTDSSRGSNSTGKRQLMPIGVIPAKESSIASELGIEDSQSGVSDDLFEYGTLGKLKDVKSRGEGEWILLLEGIARIQIHKIIQTEPVLRAEVSYPEDDLSFVPSEQTLNLFSELKRQARELITKSRLNTPFLFRPNRQNASQTLARQFDQYIAKRTPEQAGRLADFVASFVDSSFLDKKRVLSTLDINERLELVISGIKAEMEFNSGGVLITSIIRTDTGLPDNERERQNSPLDIIRRSGLRGLSGGKPNKLLGGFGSQSQDDREGLNDLDELQERLNAAKMTGEVLRVAEREMKRLRKMNPAQAEYQVCRTYLETLADVPWSITTVDQLGPESLSLARKQLNADHYGLEPTKKRLLEYLAVLKLKKSINSDLDSQIARLQKKREADLKAEAHEDDITPTLTEDIEEKLKKLESQRKSDRPPILLLVGPPGTGKTSLAKSIAAALGRKFQRISLGGVRDEAEIRGHRRTYVAAMPGLIVNGLRKARSRNPVFLLDEIDKLAEANFHGSPSAAMLEVCDPEQNHTFTDHYLSVPVDLSQVLFIATANSLSTIPPALIDRMEVISIPGYTSLEKRHIAAQHLIPKQIAMNGLESNDVELPKEVLDEIITSYTREAGVRNLERELGSVCRHKAVELTEARDDTEAESFHPTVTLEDLVTILGPPKFEEEIAGDFSKPGVVTGLVAYSIGGHGSILFIEVASMPGKGNVSLTGKLGDVLKESVQVALSWVKSHSFDLGITKDPEVDIMKDRSLHVHCPSGAIPKDGPSAGLAHAIALISLFSGKSVDPRLAMTGEISLRGRITAVGGIKEKLIGALRAGVTTVLLPAQNRKDMKELPSEVTEGLKIIHVSHVWEAMQHVWPEAYWPGAGKLVGMESRL